MTDHVEQLEFQAETHQLLELMIHSVYSNKDTFLRELISNASDALDKLRLESFRDKDLEVDTSDLHIELEVDKDARVLTVRDNGIGMSRAEVVDLIGTLAKSGTAELRRQLLEMNGADADSPGRSAGSAPADLIGQFGIGFYSTFMVADKVTLTTRRAGESEGTRWESAAGSSTYTIETLDEAPQGTAVSLHLKSADEDDHLFDYTQEWKLREIVKKYSDFISWPIRMQVERTVTEGEGEEKTEKTILEEQTLNSQKALWTRPRSDVSDEEYKEFYKHVSHAWDDPLEIIPLKAEGTFEYQALLFIPSHAPFDLFMREHKRGVQLYVRRVFIMDNCEELMPEYLRFVKGVVDAQDLSLNVSREILQQDRQIQMIRKRLVRKVLSTIKDMQGAESAESGDGDATAEESKYRTFWNEFGRVLKEGLLSDFDNRETILQVSSFASTHSDSEPTTLAQYVERMAEGQDKIYYMTGESRQQIENSPHMEAFEAKGLEVLILTDPVDEMWVGSVPDFDGKPFQSIAKGEVDLETEEEKKASEQLREQQEKDFGDVLKWLRETLSDSVKEVRLSSRLTTSPACVVGDVFDFTPQLERMYRASGQALPESKRILELNPEHPLVTGLRDAYAANKDTAEESGELAATAELLYGTAILAEGGELKDPAHFAQLLADRLTKTV
ncbi:MULTISPECIES: molecular chaperone HtpG [Nocardia]|uniref:molecular chaperone HtpG n=1 Tax=Nocardia TaxID=1817 RepID=UPI0007EB366C|nr:MULTISPECIES: molecular chaperone HtpG [Nocardia]OBF62799.1 molecular chaperone HtpG [Mycobacterium sp. 852002-51759_SCH5129042]MBF6276058.1 molecular chaperone HtpG [Nocardia nova]OBA54366.1 molecular chaperone HtpG [Nocardia sp. 852002-51101_SCH5132738]OBB49853.1 molecular chaperone HtpG [Nocardia sp. 852002-51244_SCH5132740]PPI98841.1 molecular chaperone HtpG [Nocardia nova]